MKHTFYIAVFFLCSCANVVAPTGGPKDMNPPQLLEITPNNKIKNFDRLDVTFIFDELIQINDKKNVFFSPYSKDALKIDVNKNKLTVNFEKELIANTTYYMNLDEVVKDVNEGNIVKELDYLFSTGNTIDTLTISGFVGDAKTSKPLEEVWVGLYKNDADSLVYKETPKYVVKSNKAGEFSFSNLAKDSFYIYAIEDLDNNLKFTIPNEKVGFYDKKVVSQSKGIEMYLFDETALADTVMPIAQDSSLVGYGKLVVDSLPNYPLVLELLKDDHIVRRIKATHKTSIDSLKAGMYSLRLIKDENQNGIWDSGKLIHKRAAEKVWLYPKEINIRDNWDVVIEWETNQ
ncbi:MAG: Ig-like domain-containing protein [Flavobacteriales bacterium]|nr:Ig-like domain-containing protein [Flavobacteriales bacterium]